MTHQKSLFNPKLAFEDMKQNKHVIILYTVILLLCTLFPASLEYSNYFEDTVNNSYGLASAADFLALANPFVMILTFAAAFIILLCRHRRIGIFVLVLSALIAFSRMYLYVHFPTDILGGIVLAALVAVASYNISRAVFSRIE